MERVLTSDVTNTKENVKPSSDAAGLDLIRRRATAANATRMGKKLINMTAKRN